MILDEIATFGEPPGCRNDFCYHFPMNQTPAKSEAPAQSLGMWDAVSIIVGIIIGATIYQMPPLIFSNFDRPEYAIGAWVLGGILSLVGALCYAELATTYPTTGGDYIYLSRAYGPAAGFLFAWSELSVIRTGGSIAVMAYVFADAVKTLPHADFHPRSGMIYAAAAIIALALVNLAGLRPGKWTQNLLTSVKVLGVGGIIVAGAVWYFQGKTPVSVAEPKPLDDPWGGFALAMVFIFYAFGGWNEAAYVAAEVKNRRKNILRSLMIGVGAVSLIYVAVNLAYLGGLGREGVRSFGNELVPARVLRLHFGDNGAIAMTILVIISALGAINGLLFTGIRLYGTFGRRESLFGLLARRGGWKVAPGALAAQVFFSLALIGLVEFSDSWKPGVKWLGETLGWTVPKAFSASGPTEAKGFKDLMACTAPVFWLYFTLTGFAVLVLRRRDGDAERPFRVPLYPILPLVFVVSSLFMLYRSTKYAFDQGPAEAAIVIVFMLLGVPLYALSGPPRGNTTSGET
jgi:APA family basic amino acid/polyamine antiporter